MLFVEDEVALKQVLTLSQVLEQWYKFQELPICFIDLPVEFDPSKGGHSGIYFEATGSPKSTLGAYRSSTKVNIGPYGEEPPEFPLDSGARQDWPLLPALFNYTIEWILSCALNNFQRIYTDHDYWVTHWSWIIEWHCYSGRGPRNCAASSRSEAMADDLLTNFSKTKSST